jgi:hypothetical protein
MFFDDGPRPQAHRNLPLENMQELAARMRRRPAPPLVDLIVEAVKRRARGRNYSKVSPSRIRSDLQRARIDVTVEQVAWVIVTVM